MLGAAFHELERTDTLPYNAEQVIHKFILLSPNFLSTFKLKKKDHIVVGSVGYSNAMLQHSTHTNYLCPAVERLLAGPLLLGQEYSLLLKCKLQYFILK